MQPAQTIAEAIEVASAQCRSMQQGHTMPAAREFSLAITALEDARMRATRGLAMALDCFAPADLQRQHPSGDDEGRRPVKGGA